MLTVVHRGFQRLTLLAMLPQHSRCCRVLEITNFFSARFLEQLGFFESAGLFCALNGEVSSCGIVLSFQRETGVVICTKCKNK